jgi:flagellar protein FlbD
MIVMHRLGQSEPFQLNPDLIVTVEAHPDTVVTLATGTKIVVAESPEEVSDSVRDWRVSIVNEAWRARRGESAANPALV